MNRLKTVLSKYFGNDRDFDIEDFIHKYGDPRQALLHFRVFFPEFTEVNGFVVLKSVVDSEDGPTKLESLLSNPQDAQKVLEGYRWVEVPYMFLKDDLDDDEDTLLAQLMAETWKGALMSQFPQQKWTTRVLEPEETGSTVGVAFQEDL